MRQIKLSLIASTALLVAGVTHSASAADLGLRAPITKGPIVAPVSHWGGFYVSGSAGGTWTRSDFNETSNTPFTETDTKTQSVTCTDTLCELPCFCGFFTWPNHFYWRTRKYYEWARHARRKLNRKRQGSRIHLHRGLQFCVEQLGAWCPV